MLALNEKKICTVMSCHIYQLHSHSRSIQSSFHHTFGRTHKCVHRPVGGHAWVYVKKRAALYGGNGLRYGINHLFISSFGEVWNTFNDSSHGFVADNLTARKRNQTQVLLFVRFDQAFLLLA